MILWLTSKSGYNPGIRAVLLSNLRARGVAPSSVIFNSLHFKAPLLAESDPKRMLDKFTMAQARKVLDNEIAQLRPSLIVVNDLETLRVVTGIKVVLGRVRGSLYWYGNPATPCIVIDGFNSIRFSRSGKFIFELDLDKIARWALGQPKNEPAFDYRLCKTVDEVAKYAAEAENATMVSSDTETSAGFISCVTYTYDTRDGKLISFVVPFFDPRQENGAYWQEEADEVRVRKILRKLNASSVVKAYQNGMYDAAYKIKEGFPPVNFLVDTKTLMHSLWIEAPRALHNIASYFVDHYTYWKDDSKGDDDGEGWMKNDETINKYWNYNALDGYYTWLGAIELISRITKLKWAMRNYSERIALSCGPLLAASLRGILVAPNRHSKIMREQQVAAQKGEQDLNRLTGEPDFNVNSSNDVAWLLYDLLGAKRTRIQRKGTKLGPRSTDEKVLRLMKEQRNVFVNNAIDRILRAKKPLGVLSKYGDIRKLTYRNNRFLSWHASDGTDTYRLNSTNSQFWTGTNIMNLQPNIQEMFVADPDYIFLDIDFSASDDWFIAHEAQDEDKINVLKTKDVHSYHASKFFKLDYDKVVKGKKNHEDWVVNAITGVRQVSKKVAHGRNFRMEAEMLYNLAGRDMMVATAKLMGYKNADGLDDKELIGICKILIDMYDHKTKGMYKRIRPWQDETVVELKVNQNNAINAFGQTRHFFGSADDPETQRALSAYYGQSGTAGNANRSLTEIYYSGVDDGKNCLFLAQVHDSFLFMIHKDCFNEKIKTIKAIMEKEIELKGRKFSVPVNIEVGLTWGKKLMPWIDTLTYSDIVKHEKETYALKFPEGNEALLEELGNINFTEFNLSELDELGEEVEVEYEPA